MLFQIILSHEDLQMSETFEFEVAFSTTFEQIESLRAKMLAFVKAEMRDFLPSFDVSVKGVEGIEYTTLLIYICC